MKRITIIIMFLALLAHSQNSISQHSTVDFLKAAVVVQLDSVSNKVEGSVTFDLKILKDTPSIFLDAKNLITYNTFIDGKEVKMTYNGKQLIVLSRFRKSETSQIKIDFTSYPSQAMYFIDQNNDRKWDQVWTQGQGKYTSNWLPSIDDMNDKIIWSFEITAPASKQVIANGLLNSVQKKDRQKVWRYEMKKPMSSYLVALAAGDYEVKKDSSATGVPLEFYYYKGMENNVSSTYQHSKNIFDFLELEIGVPYPWGNYKQVPVKDFLYSGMENTGMTIFSDAFFTDQLGANDRSYVNVNAHELAHQWFGNLVTESEPKHHWLHEGFATYYALLAEKELYGNSYFQEQLFKYAEMLNEQTTNGKSTALLDPNSNSLTFYQHGAWALHALKDKVGESRFRESVTTYLKKYSYKNVTTDDFLQVVEEISQDDLTGFKTTWLTSDVFPAAEALKILRKQPIMEQYLQLSARRISTFEESYNSYKETLQQPVELILVKEMVAQLSIHDHIKKYDLLQHAAALNDIEVNQLIALTTPALNDFNRDLITSMANDPSYVTREAVLFLLWNDVTDKRAVLERTKEQWKEVNAPLDMAWTALALNTTGYTNDELLAHLERLQKYTAAPYSMETRTAAFDYLIHLDAMSLQNYRDLMDASLHHVWRFYENARKILKKQCQNKKSRSIIEQSIKELDVLRQDRINKILEME
jgi:aminopeptidase N